MRQAIVWLRLLHGSTRLTCCWTCVSVVGESFGWPESGRIGRLLESLEARGNRICFEMWAIPGLKEAITPEGYVRMKQAIESMRSTQP